MQCSINQHDDNGDDGGSDNDDDDGDGDGNGDEGGGDDDNECSGSSVQSLSMGKHVILL